MLATADLLVRIQTYLKNHKWAIWYAKEWLTHFSTPKKYINNLIISNWVKSATDLISPSTRPGESTKVTRGNFFCFEVEISVDR
jgi:hypothetical protein